MAKLPEIEKCVCGGTGVLHSDFSAERVAKRECCTAYVGCEKCEQESDIADSCMASCNTEADAILAWNRVMKKARRK